MEHSHSASYAAAGVDIEAGYEGVRLMKKQQKAKKQQKRNGRKKSI